MTCTDEFIRVFVLESIIEAQLVAAILAEQHIPHQIRSYHDTAYDGLFQFQRGWGEVCSPLRFHNEILEIVREIRTRDIPE